MFLDSFHLSRGSYQTRYEVQNIELDLGLKIIGEFVHVFRLACYHPLRLGDTDALALLVHFIIIRLEKIHKNIILGQFSLRQMVISVNWQLHVARVICPSNILPLSN